MGGGGMDLSHAIDQIKLAAERAGGWPVMVTGAVGLLLVWLVLGAMNAGGAKCPHCNVRMRRQASTIGRSSGCLTMIMGLLIFLFIPLVGWVLGPIVILVGMFSGKVYKRKQWKCPRCKLAFDR